MTRRDCRIPLGDWLDKSKHVWDEAGLEGSWLTPQSFLREAVKQTCFAVITGLRRLYLSSLFQQQKNAEPSVLASCFHWTLDPFATTLFWWWPFWHQSLTCQKLAPQHKQIFMTKSAPVNPISLFSHRNSWVYVHSIDLGFWWRGVYWVGVLFWDPFGNPMKAKDSSYGEMNTHAKICV